MIENDRKLIRSDNCRKFKQGNVTVHVNITQIEGETKWHLETDAAITTNNTTLAWHDLFDTEDEALAEFARTLADEGIEAFVDPAKPKLRDLTPPRSAA